MELAVFEIVMAIPKPIMPDSWASISIMQITCPERDNAFFPGNFIAPANHQKFICWFAFLKAGSIL